MPMILSYLDGRDAGGTRRSPDEEVSSQGQTQSHGIPIEHLLRLVDCAGDSSKRDLRHDREHVVVRRLDVLTHALPPSHRRVERTPQSLADRRVAHRTNGDFGPLARVDHRQHHTKRAEIHDRLRLPWVRPWNADQGTVDVPAVATIIACAGERSIGECSMSTISQSTPASAMTWTD
jgi:hypothetical protein